MLDIMLEYSLLRVDEKGIDIIVARQLTLAAKLSILIALEESKKRRILLQLGYNPEFIATLCVQPDSPNKL